MPNQIITFPDGQRVSFPITVAGRATDAAGTTVGVTRVYVAVKSREHGEWYCPTCASKWSPTFVRNVATLASPGAASTEWELTFPAYDHVHSYFVQAWAVDADGEVDTTRAQVGRFCVRDPGDTTCA